MDRFVLNYKGNKYLEVKKHFSDFNFSDYDIICEPFCGIFGFSRYAYEKGYRGEIWLNDYSKKLIDELKKMQSDPHDYCDKLLEEVEKYNTDSELSKDKDKTFGLTLTTMAITENLCKKEKCQTKVNNFLNKENEYKDFFKYVNFYNLDYKEFIKLLPNDKKVLVFYDPPYFNSSNTQYQLNMETDWDGYHDGTQMYIDIFKNFQELEYDQIIIINHISLIHYIFNDYFYKTYSGKYQHQAKNIKKHNVYRVIH